MSGSANSVGHGLRLALAAVMLASAFLAAGMGLGRLEVTGLARADGAEQQARISRELPAQATASYYDQLADIAVTQTEIDWAFVRAATLAALQREDRDTQFWAQLAFVEFSDPAGNTVLGMEAFSQSYALAGYGDNDFMMWRISFAGYIWGHLDAPLRAAVLREARYAKRVQRRALIELVEAMPDPPNDFLVLVDANVR